MVEKLITVNVIFSGKAGAGRGGIAKKGFATFAILRVEIFLLFRKAEESRCFCRAPSSLSPSLWIVSYIREEERGTGREREREGRLRLWRQTSRSTPKAFTRFRGFPHESTCTLGWILGMHASSSVHRDFTIPHLYIEPRSYTTYPVERQQPTRSSFAPASHLAILYSC